MREELKISLRIRSYQQKAETIEAKQWWGLTFAGDIHDIHNWIGKENYVCLDGDGLLIHIDKTCKEFTVQKGEWIIKTASGEIIPCKDHIFKVAFEPLQPTTNCSKLEQTFTATPSSWEWSTTGKTWLVKDKRNELAGHISKFGFKGTNQMYFDATSLRQLADLVEATLKGNE